jgi:DNA-binding transcriptional ArsR family regulator
MVILLVRHGQMLSRMHDFGAEVSSYSELLGQAYPQVSSHLKSLAVAILEKEAKLPEPRQPRRMRQTPRELALAELYGPISASPSEPKPKPQRNPQPQPQSDFLEQLMQSESSGRQDASITIKDGRTFSGLWQIGDAVKQDYMAARGISFTDENFLDDAKLQRSVAEFQLQRIDSAIDALGEKASAYDRNGLRAAAWLAGIGGMRRWVGTGGKANPADELGTSLSDYYAKFSEAKS